MHIWTNVSYSIAKDSVIIYLDQRN